jgi:hypothetical protein
LEWTRVRPWNQRRGIEKTHLKIESCFELNESVDVDTWNAKSLISLHLQFSMKGFALLIYRIVIGGAKRIDQLQSNISVKNQFNSYIQNQSQKSRPNIFTQKKHVYLIYMTTYSPKIISQSHQFFILRHFLKHFECSLSQSNESFQNKKLEQKTNQ